MGRWEDETVLATRTVFQSHVNLEKAEGAAKYMRNISPFLGIQTPERRSLEKIAWKGQRAPSSEELGRTAIKLFKFREREYHYAAYDLIDKWINQADEYFLSKYIEKLLITKSWWDTVDGLVSYAVSPLCFRYDAKAIVDDWSRSKNRWLVRAAITHQRGWKEETDIKYLFSIFDEHWDDKEFFIAKAIGWALRDIARIYPQAVRSFLQNHPSHNAVARREAERGL